MNNYKLTILFAFIISVAVYPQGNKLDSILLSKCIYPALISNCSNDTILVNAKKQFFRKDSNILRLEQIRDISDTVKFRSSDMKLLWITEALVEDGSQAAMLKVNGRYGLFFDLSDDDYLPYNLLLTGLSAIKLDSKEKVLEYIDFILRLSDFENLGFYRINKAEDIWTYPQYVFNKYYKPSFQSYLSEALKVFNPGLLVERIEADEKYIDKPLNNFSNYRLYSDTLRGIISPSQVAFSGNIIEVKTFMASRWNTNISQWEFLIETDGSILKVAKKNTISKKGFDYREYDYIE